MFHRRLSNCAADQPAKKKKTTTTTVTSSTEGSQAQDGEVEQRPEEQIVTPPDELIAREMAETPEELAAIPSRVEAMKAVTTGIHLQETRKPRMTPAARQREALTNIMISYINKATSQEKDEDDELDLSFAGLAQQMRLHLNKTQRQRVLNKVTNVIGDCIENVLSGLPLFGVQHIPQANYSQMNIMPQQPTTPQAQPQRAAGDNNLGFYNQMQYADNELNYTSI